MYLVPFLRYGSCQSADAVDVNLFAHALSRVPHARIHVRIRVHSLAAHPKQ
jgi:hypothetical protein